ncbi:hypothetical protein V8F06_011291 [Rhypophila decipiens]
MSYLPTLCLGLGLGLTTVGDSRAIPHWGSYSHSPTAQEKRFVIARRQLLISRCVAFYPAFLPRSLQEHSACPILGYPLSGNLRDLQTSFLSLKTLREACQHTSHPPPTLITCSPGVRRGLFDLGIWYPVPRNRYLSLTAMPPRALDGTSCSTMLLERTAPRSTLNKRSSYWPE